MKPIQLIALVLLAVGGLLALLAFTTGERVIVGALEGGQPVFARPTNKPMLSAGIVLMVAAVPAFAAGLFGKTSAAPSPASADPANAKDPPGEPEPPQ